MPTIRQTTEVWLSHVISSHTPMAAFRSEPGVAAYALGIFRFCGFQRNPRVGRDKGQHHFTERILLSRDPCKHVLAGTRGLPSDTREVFDETGSQGKAVGTARTKIVLNAVMGSSSVKITKATGTHPKSLIKRFKETNGSSDQNALRARKK